ncbi:hypothetical protein QUC31_009727 [Theobroma cacao]
MLTKLGLSDNNLQGNIPSSIGKCEILVGLSLAKNNLSGSIPPEVIGLSSLSIVLNLSSNSLTGVLPVEVENMKNLGELSVSQNRLSGVLPDSLGSCVRLERLLLDGNFFEGPIPSSLSSLRGLEALDISDNNLSGEIPKFLVSLESLQYLNLSFNDFEGMVPIEDMQNNTSSLSSSLGLRGTFGYAPPDQVAEITDPILLQESFRGERMTSNTRNQSNQRDNRLLQCLNSILEIGVACSIDLPTERMDMTHVVAELCSIRDKLLPTRSLRSTGI